MTNEQLIVNQAHKIATLEEEKDQFKRWYLRATEEIETLKLEIQQFQQKLNGSENTL
jgi:molecular chaperone GrpE (heat shock protein)